MDASDKIKKVKAIISNCKELNIDIPKEVTSILEEMEISERDLDEVYGENVRVDIPYSEGDAVGMHWFEVNVKDLSDEVEKIRVEITW